MAVDSTAPRIFVSYARKDGKAAAAEIYRRLRDNHGFTVWRDLSDLEGGRDWMHEIKKAIDQVEYLVLVMTAEALASSIVRWEWRYARQQGVCVIPVVGSKEFDFDSVPQWMRRHSFVSPWEPDQWRRMVRTLEGPCREIRVPFMAGDLPHDFIRRPEVDKLTALLLEDSIEEPVSITTGIQGAGGFGKTTLAKAVCHQDAIQDAFHDGILWVTLGPQPGELSRHLGDLIEILTSKRPTFTTMEAFTARFVELISDRRLLIVIDDVWDLSHLDPFLQGGPRCARLVTTRNSDALPADTLKVRVDAMQPDDALALLHFQLPAGQADSLILLADRLGRWPLLLTLVNRALHKRVKELKQPFEDALAYVDEALAFRGIIAFDVHNSQHRDKAVAKTLGVSLALLSEEQKDRFEELAIFPWDYDVSLAVVEVLWQRTAGLTSFETGEFCQQLFDLSLISGLDLSTNCLRLHRAIGEYLQGTIHQRLPALHAELVNGYRDGLSKRDINEPAEVYFQRLLAYHLYESGQYEKLLALPTEDWRSRKRKQFGSNMSFRLDLAKAAEGARNLPFCRAVPHLLKFALMRSRVDNAEQQLPIGALEVMAALGDLEKALEYIRFPMMLTFETLRRAAIIKGLANFQGRSMCTPSLISIALEGIEKLRGESSLGSRSYLLARLLEACPQEEGDPFKKLLVAAGSALDEIQQMPGHEHWYTPSIAAELARLWTKEDEETAARYFESGFDFLYNVVNNQQAQLFALNRLLGYWADFDAARAIECFQKRLWSKYNLPVKGMLKAARSLGNENVADYIVRFVKQVMLSSESAIGRPEVLVELARMELLGSNPSGALALIEKVMSMALAGLQDSQGEEVAILLAEAAELCDHIDPSRADEILDAAWEVLIEHWAEERYSPSAGEVIEVQFRMRPDSTEQRVRDLTNLKLKASALCLVAKLLANREAARAYQLLDEGLELREHPRPIGGRSYFYLSLAKWQDPQIRHATEAHFRKAASFQDGLEQLSFVLPEPLISSWRLAVLAKLPDEPDFTTWLGKTLAEWSRDVQPRPSMTRLPLLLTGLSEPLLEKVIALAKDTLNSYHQALICGAIAAGRSRRDSQRAIELLEYAMQLCSSGENEVWNRIVFAFLAGCGWSIDRSLAKRCWDRALVEAECLDARRSDDRGRYDDLLDMAQILIDAGASELALPAILSIREPPSPSNEFTWRVRTTVEEPEYEFGMGRRAYLLALALGNAPASSHVLVEQALECSSSAVRSLALSIAAQKGSHDREQSLQWVESAFQSASEVQPHDLSCLLKADAVTAMNAAGENRRAFALAVETAVEAIQAMRREGSFAGFTRVTGMEDNYAHAVGRCLVVICANNEFQSAIDVLTKVYVLGNDALYDLLFYIPQILRDAGCDRDVTTLIQQAEEQACSLFLPVSGAETARTDYQQVERV